MGKEKVKMVAGMAKKQKREKKTKNKKQKGKEKPGKEKEKGNLGMVKGKEKGKPGKEKGRNLEMIKEKEKGKLEKGRNQGMGKEKEKGRKQGKGKEKEKGRKLGKGKQKEKVKMVAGMAKNQKREEKPKKPRINGRRNKPKKIGGQSRQTTINLTCLRDAVTYTKFLKDNVVNFLRRNTRLAKQNKLTNNKAGKKGEFKEPAARLIQSGGGDITNLSCSGSTTNVGAKKMLNATNTLDACEVSIKKACKPPAANETFLKLCGTNAVKFNTTVVACVTKATKGQDACSCFQASEVAAEKKVLESCKGKSEATAAAKARTACLKVIQKCKTAATTAGVLQYACRFTTDEMLGTLKQLSLNSAAFKALLDKIKSLTGLEPQKPGSSSNR